jgi:DNA-directed RNA polymerase sigma subunit (sigma70/sigma32)
MKHTSWLAKEAPWPQEAWDHVAEKAPRAAGVLRRYWQSDKTLAEVAKEMGVTQERVRQMVLRAWRIGRHFSNVWTPRRQWEELRDERRKEMAAYD